MTANSEPPLNVADISQWIPSAPRRFATATEVIDFFSDVCVARTLEWNRQAGVTHLSQQQLADRSMAVFKAAFPVFLQTLRDSRPDVAENLV